MAKRQNLCALQAGQNVEETYLLTKKEILTSKNGNSYGALGLSDATARIEAKLWERAEELLRGLEEGQVVKVWGKAQNYQGQIQLVVAQIAFSPESNPTDFMVQGPKAGVQLWAEFDSLLKKIADPGLKRLLGSVFAPNFRPRFGSAPAAKAAHHAYVGGLLEHTVSVGQLAVLLAGHYPHLDRDLLLSGALLHDIGKVEELVLGPPLDYSDAGRLEGHIILGLRRLDAALAQQPGFPEPLAGALRHLLVSHHGQEAFGSPQKPKTPEALALHVLDDLDAKTQMVKALVLAAQPGKNWSSFHALLERQIYLKDAAGNSRGGAEEEKPKLSAGEFSLFRQLDEN
ncbi:MAG: HD domain-containing protein [Desulfarculales bacterium]|jgi:3'-5' exoribonuclease|nr:HD domain-containing protein [Desulfarculales bacterium]